MALRTNIAEAMQDQGPSLGELLGQGHIRPVPLPSQQWQPGIQGFGVGGGTMPVSYINDWGGGSSPAQPADTRSQIAQIIAAAMGGGGT